MSETKDAELLPVESKAITLAGDAGDFAGYQGVATVALNPDQVAKLKARMPEDAYDILPTGEVYVSQVHYRRLLNDVFGPGSWALVPRGVFAMQGNTITREYALVGPGGRFISEAIGEADYQPTNARMSYASACEACKSNALTRCCKDIGIASECWDKRFCEDWKSKNAVAVWRKGGDRKPQWRRRDATPFFDETGEVQKRAGEQQQSPSQAHREPGPDDAPAPSGTASCSHCGSVNVEQDSKAPDWLRCKDCNKGTKRG